MPRRHTGANGDSFTQVEPATLRIRGGVIIGVEGGYRAMADCPAEAQIYDAGDAYLMPGAVDIGVRADADGSCGSRDFELLTTAAARGGVTSVVVQLRPDGDGLDVASEVERCVRACLAQQLSANVAFSATLSPGTSAEAIAELYGLGAASVHAHLSRDGPYVPAHEPEDMPLLVDRLQRAKGRFERAAAPGMVGSWPPILAAASSRAAAAGPQVITLRAGGEEGAGRVVFPGTFLSLSAALQTADEVEAASPYRQMEPRMRATCASPTVRAKLGSARSSPDGRDAQELVDRAARGEGAPRPLAAATALPQGVIARLLDAELATYEGGGPSAPRYGAPAGASRRDGARERPPGVQGAAEAVWEEGEPAAGTEPSSLLARRSRRRQGQAERTDDAGGAQQGPDIGELRVVACKESDALLRRAVGREYLLYLRSSPADMERRGIASVARALSTRASTEPGAVRIVCTALSTEGGVAALSEARGALAGSTPFAGLVALPHLRLAADDVLPGETALKFAPPLREAEHRDALWSALARGQLAGCASLHRAVPAALKAAGTGDFRRAAPGGPCIARYLNLFWAEAAARGWAPLDIVCAVAAGPARCAGWWACGAEARRTCDGVADVARSAGQPLAQEGAAALSDAARGVLCVGAAADMVIFDPAEASRVADTVAGGEGHGGSSLEPPANGARRALAPPVGAVLATFVGGELVYRAEGFAGCAGEAGGGRAAR